MPTSISHLGGRARVNEPGRYRKKNNKNLMAQGLPTYVGMPQPLRNLIAKRVKPSQAVAVAKKKPSIKTIRINETDSLFINSAITLTDSGGGKVLLPGIRTPILGLVADPGDYAISENQQILIQSPVGSKISITGKYCVEASLQDAGGNPNFNPYVGFYDFIKIYDSKQSYTADQWRNVSDPATTNPGNTSGLLWFSSAEINTEGAPSSGTQLTGAAALNFYFPIRTINETSTSNQIYIHFKSDNAVVASGFDFQLNIV